MRESKKNGSFLSPLPELSSTSSSSSGVSSSGGRVRIPFFVQPPDSSISISSDSASTPRRNPPSVSTRWSLSTGSSSARPGDNWSRFSGSTEPVSNVWNRRSSSHCYRRQSREVMFGFVRIREFERMIGDSPCCSSGAPIGIGWKSADADLKTIDQYESERSLRRRELDLVLSSEEREELLLGWGFSTREIVQAIRDNKKIKNQRRTTIHTIGRYDHFEEFLENARRKVISTVSLQWPDSEASSTPARASSSPARVAHSPTVVSFSSTRVGHSPTKVKRQPKKSTSRPAVTTRRTPVKSYEDTLNEGDYKIFR